GCTEAPDGAARLVHVREHLGTRRGHARLLHERLGESLGRLDLGGGARGTEHGDSTLEQSVGESRSERSLRTHHHQAHAFALGERHESVNVRRGYRLTGAQLRNARVTWRCYELQRRMIALELPCQGVLTPSTSHQQDLHLSSRFSRNASVNASPALRSEWVSRPAKSRTWSP